MTEVRVEKDVAKLRMTMIADFDATPEDVWDVWADPRKVERWWGPPTFPATFTRHEFFVGGESRYYMTGPNGENPHGWWRIDVLERPRRFEFVNGLAGEDGEPVPGVEPMPSIVTLESVNSGTRMIAETNFVNVDQMETMLGMGMQEGMQLAIGQIGSVLESKAA